MGSPICKLDGMYFEWSTISDGPNTRGMTLEEFRSYYRDEYGRSSIAELDRRLVRVEEIGTSSRVDESAEEVVKYNRAGPDEACLTLDGVKVLLRTGKVPTDPKFIVPEEKEQDA